MFKIQLYTYCASTRWLSVLAVFTDSYLLSKLYYHANKLKRECLIVYISKWNIHTNFGTIIHVHCTLYSGSIVKTSNLIIWFASWPYQLFGGAGNAWGILWNCALTLFNPLWGNDARSATNTPGSALLDTFTRWSRSTPFDDGWLNDGKAASVKRVFFPVQ